MAIEHEIMRDLQEVGGSKSKLVEKYQGEMDIIRNLYGGSIGDIPVNSDNPYWEAQRKLTALGKMTVPDA
jgi:hypothetical protein